MLARLRIWAYAIGAAAAAVGGAWFFGRREGKHAADARYVRRRADAMKEAQDVQDEVRQRDDDDVRDALRRWMRD